MIWRCDLTKQYERYRDEIDAAIRRVLESGRYILAGEVEAFEREFAEYVGCAFAVGVNSGTDALMMALWMLNLQKGDEVILPPFTAIPTYSALRHAGATPVFVDIHPETFLLDLEKVRRAISPRTRAIIPVHLFGNCVDIPALRDIVGPDVCVLEDCAQSHGATVRGVKTGSMGDISAFSFYPTKNLGGYGDGGMVLTNNAAWADAIRKKRMYGMISKDEFVVDGINTRLDEMQAAILRVKLLHLEEMNERRARLADLYRSLLDPAYVTPQAVDRGCVSVHHVYCVRCRERRDALLAHLESRGIQCNVYYPMPLTRQVGHTRSFPGTREVPVAEELAGRIIALPFYPEMEEDVLRRVASEVNAFFRNG